MTAKTKLSIVLAALLILTINPLTMAVSDTSEIENCCNKQLLDAEDFATIDKFVGYAIDELLNTADFSSVSSIRSVILNYSSSNRSTAQAQYTSQFSKSAYKYLSKALKDAEAIKSEQRRYKVVLNLLILINDLEDIHLTELAEQELQGSNNVICYWAVRCVTNPAIIEAFNSSDGDNLIQAKRIARKLDEIAVDAGPEILSLMVKFSEGININAGGELLLKIADVRISRYANWRVDYEILDADILKALYKKLSLAGNNDKPAVAHRFAQLFSFAVQRYIKGREFLNDTQKRYLASVLIETERECISKMFSKPQAVIAIAIENDSYINLLQEHNRLLGDRTRQGEIPKKYKFDYGQNSNGSRRNVPPSLPEPLAR